MRVLVAIASYGIKNIHYARRLIHEYRSMPFAVDIFVLTESYRDYGDGVGTLVGLPSRNPWSLPFAHKKLFAENAGKYDLFIYSEDDILIRTRNIVAFLAASKVIGDDRLAGFIRYERYPNGKKNYPDMFGSFHWLPDSVRTAGEYAVARFSNEHSACYMLTREQLQRAIGSGGFLVPPHCGKYDLICSAAVDPYVQCGFTRVICISHLKDFEVHHLSNAYLNRLGLGEDEFMLQLEALLEILRHERSSEKLFPTEKPINTPVWNKRYYEPRRDDILRAIPPGAGEILLVGCGWGATEALLNGTGRRVTAIPLDAVVGKLAERHGIQALPPNFAKAFEMLQGRKFDAIVLSEVLQHVPEPIKVLTQLRGLLTKDGVLVGSVANLGASRRMLGQLLRKRWARQLSASFEKTSLRLTSASTTRKWLAASGLRPVEMRYERRQAKKAGAFSSVVAYLPGAVSASNISFTARKANS